MEEVVNLCQGCDVSYLDSKNYTDKQVFNFLLEHGVITNSFKCPECGKTLVASLDTRPTKHFRCSGFTTRNKKKRAPCGFQKSFWAQTFFHRSPPASTLFRLVSAALWSLPSLNTIVQKELGSRSQLVESWYLPVREVFIDAVSENSKKLGGKDQLVELVEATWGSNNLNKGLWNWALGGIDRHSGETFFVPVEHNNLKSLREIISQKINPGTVIVTNCTKDIPSEDIEELKSSLGVSFVYPASSTIDTAIKHYWREVNRGFTSLEYGTHPPYSMDQLGEYLFKSKHQVHAERMHAFFVAAGRLYPPDKPIKTWRE